MQHTITCCNILILSQGNEITVTKLNTKHVIKHKLKRKLNMATLTQNTIEGTLVFVSIQTPQTKYQSTEKEYKAGVVVDEDTADSWNEMFPKQSAKVVKTSDFKDAYKIDAPFPNEKKQYVITLKKPAQYKDGSPLPTQYCPKVLLQEGKTAIDITHSTLPANGSKGKISFEENSNDFGTFARLRNVLVTDLIEYKKGGGNAADEFGLEVQGASDFDDNTETPVVKQPKPTTVPEESYDDDVEQLPF